MVLATNEWLNDSKDDSKSNGTPTTTTSTTSTNATATNPEIVTETTTNEDKLDNTADSQTNLATKTTTVDIVNNPTLTNANTDNLGDLTLKLNIATEDLFDGNRTNDFRTIAMAENDSDLPPVTVADDDISKTADNNNFFNKTSILQDETSLEEHHQIENRTENANKILTDHEYSALDDTNRITVQSIKNPITSHALSCALESVMNSSSINTNVSNSLQNNFLNGLGMNQLNSYNSSLDTKKNLNNSANANNNNSINLNNSGNNLDTKSIIECNGQAKIVLTCEPKSHKFETRTILLTPNIECKVGRLIAKSKPSESNAIFDCKVLSRNHAVLWYSDEGKFYVKDTNSSNGTYINDKKLDADAVELHFGDIVKFGVDVVENLKKEVHGCIIANVKLYLPDGREAISIDSASYRSQFSAEKKISCDELHRLSLYMQEASQREKVLKSKLCNIQNILDATRKNSGMCWQSMIAEDQLLHRIHSLEKKLQIMEKNVPESALRNEILKLLEDKNTYQNSVKETLQTLYKERNDAMELVSKLQGARTNAESECRILRDQFDTTQERLHDMNDRLLNLEAECVDYKTEAAHQLQEAKEQAEQCMIIMKEKLREREIECEELRHKLSELLSKRTQSMSEEVKLATDKLDAALADMDVGDDEDDDDDDDDEDDDDDDEEDDVDPNVEEVVYDKIHKNDHISNNELYPEQKQIKMPDEGGMHKESKQIVNEATIMKWLQNSDLNKKDGSDVIFKAICYDSDSCEEQDNYEGAGADIKLRKPKKMSEKNFKTKCENFMKVFEYVKKSMQKIKPNIANNIDKVQKIKEQLENEQSLNETNGVEQTGSQNDEQNKSLSEIRQSYVLLRMNINTLNKEYSNIYEAIASIEAKIESGIDSTAITNTDNLPKQEASVKTIGESLSSTENAEFAETTTITNTVEVVMDGQFKEEIHDSDESSDEDELTARISSMCLTSQLQPDLQSYEEKILNLAEKLEQSEMQSQQTLDIMQHECDELKDKVLELTNLVTELRTEKEKLEQDQLNIDEKLNAINSSKDKTNAKMENIQDTFSTVFNAQFEKQTNEDLNVINNSTLQQEEELVMYKEILEQTQLDNVQLRHEIAELKLKTDGIVKKTLLKRILPYGAVVIAIVIYILSTYY